MPSPALNIALTMALCYLAWGFFFFFMHRRKINFSERYGWTTLYFLVVAAGLSLLFWNYLQPVVQVFSLTPLLVLGTVMLAQFGVYHYVPRYLQEPRSYFDAYPNRHYLKLGWQRVVAKSAEIFAQQIFIMLLVLFLSEFGLTYIQLAVAFGTLFLLLHIPLLINERGQWPMWAFLGAVIGFSITFPYFILYVPYGFAYNIAIHWLFYTAMAVSFWLWHAKRTH